MNPIQRSLRAAIAVFLLIFTSIACAADYPDHPIRIIVPYAPGGSADILARLLGEQLQNDLRQPFVIENRPGGGSIIGARSVVNAPPDGYTLLLGTVSSNAMTPAVNPTAGYDPVKAFTPVARLASMPFVLLARPGLGVTTMSDLIQKAREQPGALTYGSAGVGTSNHMAGELFSSQSGAQMIHVPYRGSAPAMNALLAGEVDIMFDLVMTAASHIRAGSVVALGTTGAKRSQFLPNIPTLSEQGLDHYQVTAWFGLFGPSKLPDPVVAKLHDATNAALAQPGVEKRLEGLGVEPEIESTEAFGRFVQAESLKWKMIVQERRIAAGG